MFGFNNTKAATALVEAAEQHKLWKKTHGLKGKRLTTERFNVLMKNADFEASKPGFFEVIRNEDVQRDSRGNVVYSSTDVRIGTGVKLFLLAAGLTCLTAHAMRPAIGSKYDALNPYDALCNGFAMKHKLPQWEQNLRSAIDCCIA